MTIHLVAVPEVMLLGRLLFALYFAEAGLRNVRASSGMIQRMRAQPMYPPFMRAAPALFIHVSNACLVLGSVSVALGAWGDLGALLLIAFLVPVTLVTYPYWRTADPAEKRISRSSFYRNAAHVGACLLLFGAFQGASPLMPALTAPFFTLR